MASSFLIAYILDSGRKHTLDPGVMSGTGIDPLQSKYGEFEVNITRIGAQCYWIGV